LRHLDAHGSEPDAVVLAEALARFLVARCESHHAGWRVVRQVVVDSSADAPWEKCARRAVPLVAADLLSLSGAEGRTPLHRAQHVAAQRRAEEIAGHVNHAVVLKDLGLEPADVDEDRWREAIGGAVKAKSREQVARRRPNRGRSRARRTPVMSGPRTAWYVGPVDAVQRYRASVRRSRRTLASSTPLLDDCRTQGDELSLDRRQRRS
jgi:hypothetical protein